MGEAASPSGGLRGGRVPGGRRAPGGGRGDEAPASRWAVPPLLLLAACEGTQSAFAPHGIQAERIATLGWVLFAVCGAVLALVLGLAAIALRGPGRWRAALAGRRTVLLGGIAFPVVALALLLAYGLGVSRALVLPLAPGEAPLRIEVIGRQYWWEVRYPDAGEGAVTANELRLPVGREVELHVSSGDVIHSIWIPALHGKIDMIPGRVNRQRLRADRPGRLRGQCTEFCGTQHALMAFDVVAEEPAAFEAWLARQRAAVPEPATPALARGRQVFGEAGCGACHAVRGTGWNARLAPDLSRVGSRLTLGAGALANDRGAMAGWIAGAQDIKPGNFMPSYARALAGADLVAVAGWLESLR
ncbi:c-type cytochrome [Roseomonas sp. NAR14]|uniref:C-type cytochrome n=1 Tax=Roseomonas acroporae TaxID=2937791 RepID=A0A9X1YEC9_9PROT|nr:c-type cytochrome [Roseomonas acroporae]